MQSGPKVILGIFGLAGLAMCSLLFWHPFPERETQGLPDLGQLPEFHLVDQENHPIDVRSLFGHLTVLQVMCSRCAPSSAVLLSRFAEIDQNFRRSSQLRLMSLAAEPSVDSSAILATIHAHYEGTDHWLFLTGEERELTRLVVALFGVGKPNSGTVLTQAATSGQVALVDSKGRLRRIYEGLGDNLVASVLSDAGTLLRSSEKEPK